jgi:L-fuconolactonase
MLTIDAQVHTYERNHPGRPWAAVLHGPPEVTGDDMVAAMDAVGVDGALLISPFTLYRFDASYAVEVGARHPGRFGLIKPVDPSDPAVAETVAAWAATPGTVGIRIMMNRDVVDHLGLQQPFEPPPPAQPFADLPAVLKLAGHRNVAIKITGACTLSREAYPFKDIWDPLARIFDAFGIDRCMWGTDWTRADGLLTYQQGVDAFRSSDRLSESDKSTLMGGALQRVYKWSPKRA